MNLFRSFYTWLKRRPAIIILGDGKLIVNWPEYYAENHKVIDEQIEAAQRILERENNSYN